jgi:hypothetical protein
LFAVRHARELRSAGSNDRPGSVILILPYTSPGQLTRRIVHTGCI